MGQLVDSAPAGAGTVVVTGARFAAVLAGQEAAAAPLYVRTNLELFTRTHEQFKRAAAAAAAGSAAGGGGSSGRLFTTLISQAREHQVSATPSSARFLFSMKAACFGVMMHSCAQPQRT